MEIFDRDDYGHIDRVGRAEANGTIYDADGTKVGTIRSGQIYGVDGYGDLRRVGSVRSDGLVFRGPNSDESRRAGRIRDDGWIFRYKPEFDDSDWVGNVEGNAPKSRIHEVGAVGLLLLIAPD